MARVATSFIVCMFSTLVFLISGLLLNLLQALLYLLFYNRNKNLYRKINYYLIYTSWSQILAMAEWCSNLSCNIYGDEESLRMFGKEHTVVLMNHKYDLDWLMCWFTCEKLRMLGSAKTVAKKSLRNVPVVGWGWIFAEMIFLERNWEKDKLSLGPQLDNLMEYDDPIMLLFFCEGTRFTPEKHKAGVEFAKSRNLPLLKHHLCPRTNGFNLTAHHLKNKMNAVYDVEIAFPENLPLKPTFFNIIWGNTFVGDMYIRRIPMDQIPTDTEEATSKWVHNLYQEKDKVLDDYFKTNKFPGKRIQLKRSIRTLLHALFWNLLIGLPFLYLIFKLLFMGSPWVTVATVTVIVLLFSVMYMMVSVTEADKGSSYGSQPTGDKKSPTNEENGILNEETNDQYKNLQERELRNLNIPKVKVTMYQNDANGNEQTGDKL